MTRTSPAPSRQRPAPLYRRLPRGPSRLRREEVARNQRARLLGAMVEAVAERGYRATTVADVIALAGVSRRAFYEQFPNKEECFLAALGALARATHRRAAARWDRAGGWADRLEAAAESLLGDLAAAPKATRVLLVESLGTTAAVRERMRVLDLSLQRLIAAAFALAPDGAPLAPFAPAAIAGGLRHVAFTHAGDGSAGELAGLAGPLLDWADSYRTRDVLRPAPAGGHDRGAAEAAAGAAPPSPFAGSDLERARIVRALVAQAVGEGFAGVTEAGLAQAAGVSVDSLRRRFASREDCLNAVLAGFAGDALAAVEHGVARGAWPERAVAGVAALSAHLRTEPCLTRLAFVEAPHAGPASAALMARTTEAITRALVRGAPPGARGGAVALPATAGALARTIAAGCLAQDARRGGARPAAAGPVSVERLAFLVLAPRLGAGAAVRTITGAQRASSLAAPDQGA